MHEQKPTVFSGSAELLVMCHYAAVYQLMYMNTLENNMKAISYTSARANLASTMAHVCNDHAPIIITRKSEAPVVMMSLEDYNAMQETTYLLRSPVNARDLLESITELESGNGTERELLE